ncbi:SusC/RagA family TonB-linked outer membrane protein [Formosa sp. A9]|uniref:SusC/RagA family TonB-linked outer membrane protein n=1 Tax=Formosa sp. A9 TaxID=3442641 RepID=UPI003EBBCDF9
MNLKTQCIALALLFFNVALFAQTGYNITGHVADAQNVPIAGANILIKGSSTGTSTDFDGNFELEVKSGDVLQISYLGYVTHTVTITDQNPVKITLVEDASQLEEVVVVGYGTRKKSDITGSVASVKSEELTAYPTSNAEQALQGRAAGVVVQSNNGGEPGAPINIKIRGNTSINASSNPLIVVDGFVGAAMPQANDIASMEVLKDASATAIYGSRGSNGVILVTTKTGKSGRLNIEFNSSYAIQNTANEIDLLNADEFANYQNDIRANTGNTSPYTQGSGNTNWQDLIYRSGNTQNYQLAFSGGSEKIKFYASTNYFGQDGIVINSDFEKLTFLSNIDAQVFDNLKLGMNLYGSRDEKNGAATQSDGSVSAGGDDVITLAMRYAPDQPVYDEDGSYNSGNSVGDPVDNPYAVATERIDENKTDDFRANLFADWDIIESLSFRTTFGFSTQNRTRGIFSPSTLEVTAGGIDGRASVQNNKNTQVLSENYLTYSTTIGKGDFTLMGGYSYQKSVSEYYYMEATGFLSDTFSYYGFGSATNILQPDSTISEVEIQSQFGRLNYDWDDKYLFTATVRRDGASNFAENHKYAIFPSGAIGWKISNENFLKDSNTISNLKLRASYGVTGNPSIGAYESLARIEGIYASSNGETVSAVTPDRPGNPDLKWESSYQTNFGLDFGLLSNRINMSFDYYNINTEDLILINNALPEYAGYLDDEILTNVGEINNRGFEFALNTINISNENFTWSTDFNIAFNRNEVVSLVGGLDYFGNAAPSYFSHDRSYVLREGEAVGLFWGYDYAGVYQGGNVPAGTATLPGGVAGDPLFADLDDSGDITEADRTTIGDPNPDFTWGFTNNFTLGNFDMNIFFQGSQGNEIFNMTNVQLTNGDANTTRDNYYSAWTPTNTDTNTPRVGNNSNREISSRFVEDGSYVRLKNIAIGYTFASDVLDNIGIERLRLAISAQNLLTWTDYSGLDPEVNYFGSEGNNNFSSNTAQGFDFGNYPTVRTVTFSLNLKF